MTLLGLGIVLTLSACASLTGTNARISEEVVCKVWQPVGWVQGDTTQTIHEIKVNNAKYDSFCGVK